MPPRPLPGGKRTISGTCTLSLEELHVVADPAVLEEALAVVGGHDHDRLLAEARRLSSARTQRAHLLVGEGEVAVVEAHEVLALRAGERPPALVDVRGPSAESRPGGLGDRTVGPEARVERRLGS